MTLIPVLEKTFVGAALLGFSGFLLFSRKLYVRYKLLLINVGTQFVCFQSFCSLRTPMCGGEAEKGHKIAGQVCSHLLGPWQKCEHFRTAQEGKHAHSWYTFAPGSSFISTLSESHQHTLPGSLDCSLPALGEFQRFGGSEHSTLLLSESYCWSALTWKEICKKAIIPQAEKHLQFTAEAGGKIWWRWRKIWRKCILVTKFYFLEFPHFCSEDIAYWFWIKSE